MKTHLIISLCMIFLINLSLFSQTIVDVFQSNNSPLVYDVINDLTISDSGSIFIATEFGLSKLNFDNNWNSWNFPENNLSENVIRSIYHESVNEVFLGGFLTGLSVYNNSTFVDFPLPVELDNFVRDIVSNYPNIYVATANGIGIYNRDTYSWTIINGDNTKIPSSNISCLALNPNGQLFAGTINGGLLQIEQNSLINFFGEQDGLPDNTIADIDIDIEGDVWMATPSAGIVYFDGLNFENINEVNSTLPSNNLSAVAVSSNNNLWFGSSNNGLFKMDDSDFITFNTNNSIIPSNQINTIETIDSNEVWVGTNNGLVKLATDININIEAVLELENELLMSNITNGELQLKKQVDCSYVNVTDMNGVTSIVELNAQNKICLADYNKGCYVICCQTSNNYICERIFLLQ